MSKDISYPATTVGDLARAQVLFERLRFDLAGMPIPGCREQSLAHTKIDEAEMWLERAIVKHYEPLSYENGISG